GSQSHVEHADAVEKIAPESHIRAHHEIAAVRKTEILSFVVGAQRHTLRSFVCEQHLSAEYAQAGIGAEFAVNLIEPVLAHQYVVVSEDYIIATRGGDRRVARIAQPAPALRQMARRFWTQRGETFNDLSCLISRSVVNNNQLVIVIAGEPLLIKTPERPVERLRAIARTNQHADFHPPFSTPFPINDNSSAYSPVWR